MDEDERIEAVRRDAPVFAVAPVRSGNRVSGGIVVGLTIGLLAFVAGIGVASAETAPGPSAPGREPAAPSATLAPSRDGPVPAPGGNVGDAPATSSGPALEPGFGAPVAPATGSTPPPPPGSSAFLARFDPVAIVRAADGGARCQAGDPREKEVPRTRRDGPRMTFQRSWLAWCPIPAADRQAFLVDVFNALLAPVPADTFGFSATLAGTGDALIPYGEPPLAGTVAVTAGEAGRGLAIAVVVSEWRLDIVP